MQTFQELNIFIVIIKKKILSLHLTTPKEFKNVLKALILIKQ